eukprot:TRINITY_DN13179_c0_g1_i1.p1 TRINITY_DN13179_c0_g1~~TRINITY_DN13179_c0_g1_i1.p1  ORF type:complete len:111 (+),score=10.05 TRINITY_DN13179_c0_g1_i1:49-381(+)
MSGHWRIQNKFWIFLQHDVPDILHYFAKFYFEKCLKRSRCYLENVSTDFLEILSVVYLYSDKTTHRVSCPGVVFLNLKKSTAFRRLWYFEWVLKILCCMPWGKTLALQVL